MKTKQAYTMAQLHEVARKTGCDLEMLYDNSYRIRRDGIQFHSIVFHSVAQARLEAHQTMHRLAREAAPAPKPSPTFKVVVMTEDNKVIDEFSQVRLNHGTLEEMQRYNATLVRWIMRTAAAGEEMQASGRIQSMPKLKGAPKGLAELRKELYQFTHKPFSKEDLPAIWSRVEQLLEMAEKAL